MGFKLSSKLPSTETEGTIWITNNRSGIRALESILLKNNQIIWGDRLFTFDTFLRAFSDPMQISMHPVHGKALVFDILDKTALKYFDSIRRDVSIGNEFFKTISTLRNNFISSKTLEADLTERGSLKEFDLLTVYRVYEERIESLNKNDNFRRIGNIIHGLENNPQFLPSFLKRIVIYQIDVIPPGLEKILKSIEKHFPDIEITIVSGMLPASPAYAKYQTLICRNLELFTGYPDVPKEDSDIWNLNCAIELYRCRSSGDEARFVAAKILSQIDNGTDIDEIGIILSGESGSLKEMLHSLKRASLVPDNAFYCFDGIQLEIYRALQKSKTVKDALEPFESNVVSAIQKALGSDGFISNKSAALRQLASVFENAAALAEVDISEEIKIRALLTLATQDSSSMIDKDGLALGLRWWSEDIVSYHKFLFVPSFYQNSIPPAGNMCWFFNDLSFSPGNAPLYFSLLFPQADLTRSREIYRLRKYLSQTTERTILTYPAVSSEGKETFPSSIRAFLNVDEINADFTPPLSSIDATGKIGITKKLANIQNDLNGHGSCGNSVIKKEAVKRSIAAAFTDHIYSASQLEKYGLCPYRYYLDKVMKLEPIEPPTPEINPKHRGTIIHYTMELFFKNEIDILLQYLRKKTDFNIIENKIGKYVDLSIEKHKELLKETHAGIVEHFRKRSNTICCDAIKKEAELIDKMKFPLLPVHTEWAFGTDDVPCLEIRENNLEPPGKIRGIIDRIDKDTYYNIFAITDYKTGRTDSIFGKVEKGEHLQIPLYLEAVRTLCLKNYVPAGGFLFTLRTIEKKHGMALKEFRKSHFRTINARMFVDSEKWNEVINIALNTAANYINSIRNSEFLPNNNNCQKLCDYRNICRYDKK